MSFRHMAAMGFAALLSVSGTVRAADDPDTSASAETASEDVVVAADGSYTDTTHSEVRAVNEAGALQASRINIVYDSETQQVAILEAHTLKPDGTKIPVDVNTIYEQTLNNAFMVTSFRVKTLLFPRFSAGDTAVYTVRYTTPKAAFAGHFQFGKYFPHAMAFKDARITITAPKTMKLRVENHDVPFTKRDLADKVVYSWRVSAPASKSPSHAQVSILDREPRFFVSTFKDYTELGRAYAAQSEPKTTTTPKIKSLADEITGKTTDRHEQTNLIYEWVVTHIRYVAIELGRGSFIPHDPDETLARGYGDCKDHDVLLQALLKAKGIEADSILINSEDDYTLTEAPTFTKFNHVITFIPELNRYLDSSLPTAAFGALPVQEYGKPAVRASAKSAGAITMPLVKPGDASIHTTTIQKIDASGILSGTTETTATGPYAIDLRIIGLGVQAMGREKAAALQLGARGFSGGTGTLIEDPFTTRSNSYHIRGEFKVKGWEGVLNGDGTIMPGGLRVMVQTGDASMGPLTGGDEIKDEPTMCISAKADEDVSLELPAGYSFHTVPDDIRIATPNLTFTTHWTLSGTTLAVHREFVSKVDQPLCSGAVRKQTADALQRISKTYDKKLPIIRSLEDYSKSLSTNPKSADTLVDRGVAYEAAGEHEKAIADFNAALALKPNDSLALFNRAYVYEKQSKTDLAVEDYTKSIAFDQKNAAAYGNRGLIYERKQKYDLAIADFDKSLNLEPDDALYLCGRGFAYLMTLKVDRSIEDLEKAVSLQPDYTLAYKNLGSAYFQKHQYDLAIAAYTKAISLEPGDYGVYGSRSDVYLKIAKPDLALKDADKTIELKPDVAANWNLRGYAHSALNDWNAALADANKALSLDPQQATSYKLRAGAYIGLKNFKAALADLDKVISLSPKDAYAYLLRARAKHSMGDDIGGNQDSAKALQLEPTLGK